MNNKSKASEIKSKSQSIFRVVGMQQQMQDAGEKVITHQEFKGIIISNEAIAGILTSREPVKGVDERVLSPSQKSQAIYGLIDAKLNDYSLIIPNGNDKESNVILNDKLNLVLDNIASSIESKFGVKPDFNKEKTRINTTAKTIDKPQELTPEQEKQIIYDAFVESNEFKEVSTKQDEPVTKGTKAPEKTVRENPMEAFMEMIQNFLSQIMNWFGSPEGSGAATKVLTAQQEVKSALEKAGITDAEEQKQAIEKSIKKAIADTDIELEITEKIAGESVREYKNTILSKALEGEAEFKDAVEKTELPTLPKEISFEGQKIKLYDKDGKDLNSEITLTDTAKISTNGLTQLESAWKADMEKVQTEMQNLAKENFEEVVKEAKRQLVTEKALEMYNKNSLPANAEAEEVEIDGKTAKLVAVTVNINGKEQTIGYADIEGGKTYTGDKTDVASLKANQFDIKGKDGNKLELGSHPQAGLTGTMTAANLMDKKAEFVEFISAVYSSENPRMAAYNSGLIEKSQNGVSSYPDIGRDVFAPSMLSYLKEAENQGADLSQIKVSPEMASAFRDFLSKESTGYSEQQFINKLRDGGDNISAAIFDNPVMEKFDMDSSFGVKVASVNIIDSRTKEVVGKKDMVRYGQLPFDEANLEVFKAAGGASSEAQVGKLIADKTKNNDQFRNATLGDLAQAIYDYQNNDKDLTNAQATLYARSYLAFKAMGMNESKIENSMQSLANRIAKNGAERRLIVNPKDKGIEERDLGLLNNISKKLGDDFNIEQIRNMDVPPMLRINNQISRDAMLNSSGINPFRNEWTTKQLFEALPMDDREKIFIGFKKDRASDYAYEGLTDIGLQAGQKATKILTDLIRNKDVRDIAGDVVRTGFETADQAITAYPEDFRKYIEEYYVHKSDDMITGAKIEGKAGEKDLDKSQYKKPLEERDQYSSTDKKTIYDERKEFDKEVDEAVKKQEKEKEIAAEIINDLDGRGVFANHKHRGDKGFVRSVKGNEAGIKLEEVDVDSNLKVSDEEKKLVNQFVKEARDIAMLLDKNGVVDQDDLQKEIAEFKQISEKLRSDLAMDGYGYKNEDGGSVAYEDEAKLAKLVKEYETKVLYNAEQAISK